jgi:hypothetical protein
MKSDDVTRQCFPRFPPHRATLYLASARYFPHYSILLQAINMSGGHYLTPEQMAEVQNVSVESLAARCGIDENGPLADETRSEAERSESVKMQVSSLLH